MDMLVQLYPLCAMVIIIFYINNALHYTYMGCNASGGNDIINILQTTLRNQFVFSFNYG